VLQIEVAES